MTSSRVRGGVTAAYGCTVLRQIATLAPYFYAIDRCFVSRLFLHVVGRSTGFVPGVRWRQSFRALAFFKVC